MEETITISKTEYYYLRCNKLELERLEAGGVDNWEWYGESLNPDGEPSLTEAEETLYKEIFK